MSGDLTPIRRKSKSVQRAERCLELYKAKLKCKIPSFSYILSQLKTVPVREEIYLCTDGKKLFYNPKQILESGAKVVEHDICHIVVHGLLGHFEEAAIPYQKYEIASIVKDIQVAHAMDALHPDFSINDDQKRTMDFLFEDEKRTKVFGNELYYLALKNRNIYERLYQMVNVFLGDDHTFWMKRRIQPQEQAQKALIWKNARILVSEPKLKEAILQCLPQKQYGTQSGNRKWEFSSEDNSVTAYDVLLEEITSIAEITKEEDEFDKALYTYGLSLYGDIPILEPEECTQRKQLNTLVIALDTSSSCTGRIPSFLKEVRKLFDDIYEKVEVECVYLLQCDTQIKNEKRYYDLSAFSEAVATFEIVGGGGTNFTPVFTRIEEIQKKQKVDALFYLTDGNGVYPEGEKPSYPVCFIMPPEDVESWIRIPEWIKQYPVDMEEE